MSSVGRNLLLVAIPAAAVGVLGGLVLRALEPPAEQVPVVLPPPQVPDAADPGGHTRPGPRSGRGSSSGRPPRAQRQVVGEGREGVVRLDLSFAERLSDPDERTRHRAALDLLRLGPSRLDAIALVEPTTDEGRALRDLVVEAVTALARNEAGEDYPRLPEENRLELRLKYWGRVVPDSMLSAERKALWSQRVADDEGRVARGTITEAQAAWHRLELAYARRQLGEIGEDDWVKFRAEQMPAARGFVVELGGRADSGRDHVARVKEALDRMER